MTAAMLASEDSSGVAVPDGRHRTSATGRFTIASFSLTLVGLFLSLLTAVLSAPLVPPPQWGFLKEISPVWYVGLGMAGVSLVLSRKSATWCTAFAAISIVVIMSGSQSIVYELPRFSWVFRNIGTIEYIQRYGKIPPNIGTALDIYNSWPAYFAASAQFAKLAGIHDPTVIARWWPPIFDILSLLAMRAVAVKLIRGSSFLPWLVGVVVFLANDIGDDPHYFSPQSVAYFWALVIFALALPGARDYKHNLRFRLSVITLLGIALGVTHQITPFLVVAALVVLVVLKIVRPWWTPLLVLIPAGVWALTHLGAIRNGIPDFQVGDILANLHVRRPVTSGVPIQLVPLVHLTFYAVVAGAVILGVLAVAALVIRRNRLTLALCIAAASASSLIVVTDYGSEGSFRVALFALPWLALGAAQLTSKAWLQMTGATVVLALLIPISLVGEHGLDWFDITKPGDLTLERAFEASAPSGSILTWIGFGPYVQDSTYRYTELGSLEYDDLVNLPTPTKPTNPLTPAQSIAYLPTYIKSQDPREPDQIYAVVSITLQEQGLAYGQYSIAQYQAVAREMASSPQWELLLRTSTGALYRERS